MKKLTMIIFILTFICSILMADTMKIAILNFSNNDRESNYVASSLMKRDFKKVFDDNEDLELIKIKESEKVFKKSGITNLSYAGTEDIAAMSDQLDADVVIWGTVSSISGSKFKIITKIFNVQSNEVSVTSIIVEKTSSKRQQTLSDELIPKIRELGKKEIEKLINIGIQHFRSKNYKSAEETFTKLIELDDKNRNGYFYLGLITFLQNDYLTSVDYLEQSLAIVPEDTDALDFLSKAYLNMEDLESAAETLERITEFDDNKEIWLRIGKIYTDLQYTDKAKGAFNFAIDLDVEYFPAYQALGELLYNMEFYNEAISPLEIAAAAFPDNDDLQKKLAKCYYKTGKLESAIANYKQIIIDKPNNKTAYLNLAGAYRETNQNQKALKVLKDLKAIDPKNPKVYLRLADVYIALEDFTKATQNANQTIELSPDMYDPYRVLASIHQKLGYKKYEKFLEYEELYKDKSVYYGEKADELVEKRDNVKDEANSNFKKAQYFLDETEKRTDKSSVIKDIERTRNTLNQLENATKSGGF
ncbi:MAG: tetratricopeptide repeat protein [Candidatus Cloacimonetes bacterium]|nr:tetratricopeptide repeat protein [Candidatus Cloacimonadota bacterium]